MREIILDTETTGLRLGIDRVTEICAFDGVQTFSAKLHLPTLPPGALRNRNSRDCYYRPCFDTIVDDFLRFIDSDSIIIAHNAEFDRAMLNHELRLCDRQELPAARWYCTREQATRLFPNLPVERNGRILENRRLESLARFFDVDVRYNELHTADEDVRCLTAVHAALNLVTNCTMIVVSRRVGGPT